MKNVTEYTTTPHHKPLIYWTSALRENHFRKLIILMFVLHGSQEFEHTAGFVHAFFIQKTELPNNPPNFEMNSATNRLAPWNGRLNLPGL